MKGQRVSDLQGTVASLFQDQRPELGKSGFGLVWQFFLCICLLPFDFSFDLIELFGSFQSVSAVPRRVESGR